MITEIGYKKLWIKDDIYTLVDVELYPVLKRWKWSLSGEGYVIRSIDVPYKSTLKLHRLIAMLFYGEIKNGFVIDHIDRNKLNNIISNLRFVSTSINTHNCNKRLNTSSKYIGVCKIKSRNKYLASIGKDSKNIHIGIYADEKEAAIARDKKAIELYGKYARLNFPEMFKGQL